MAKISGWSRKQREENEVVIRIWTNDRQEVESQVRRIESDDEKDWSFGVFDVYSEDGFIEYRKFNNQEDAIDYGIDYLKQNKHFDVN